MKKLIILTCSILLGATCLMGQTATNDSPVTGQWKYAAPSAPSGYDRGLLVFSETDSTLSGQLILAGDYIINLQQLSIENNELHFSLYVDGNYIAGKAKIEDDQLEGTADTPEGQIDFTAEKIRQEIK